MFQSKSTLRAERGRLDEGWERGGSLCWDLGGAGERRLGLLGDVLGLKGVLVNLD